MKRPYATIESLLVWAGIALVLWLANRDSDGCYVILRELVC